MELQAENDESPKRYRTSLLIEIKEDNIQKQSISSNNAAPTNFYKNLRITKHTVAPSEYQAAYDTSSFPRSVFNKEFSSKLNKENQKEEVEVKPKQPSKPISLIKKIFSNKRTEEVPPERSTTEDDVDNDNENNNEDQIPSDKSNKTGYIDVILDATHISQNLQAVPNLQNVELRNRKNSHCLNTTGFTKFKLPNAIENKIFRLGEKGSGLKTQGEIQDFYELRDQHLRNGTLFEDPEFPANDYSLFLNGRSNRHYEWLRPGEIVNNPQLFVEGYSRFDVQQGELGDCWLLAAVANLTLYRRLFFQIVPDDQGFEDKYAGIFHFRFWQYGRWIDVVVDDRLPTYRGQLIYLHSNEENEFWSALLEKAYAKLHGSYEALKGGSTCEAMEDFTGGVTEMYEMSASPPNLFKILVKAYERGSLMGASLEPDPNVLEAETREGLIRGHAYSITRVKYVDIQTPNAVGKIPLLRLRNPWGNENEWNGPWSDQSPEWRFISDHEKENLGLTFDSDGEFWMSFKDFQSHFDRLEICNLTPDSLTTEELTEGNKKQWEMSVFEGDWVRGVTAGGCRNNLDTFWHNPQYRITLTDVDDDDDENKCTVIVALMQKNRRSRRLMGVEFLTIGFAIYYLPNPDNVPKPLDLNYFKYHASVARSPSFINLREVSCRFRLPPGTYCIVPSTFDPNEEGEFLLRVFSEHKNNMEYGYDYNNDSSGQGQPNSYSHNPSSGYGGYSNYQAGGYNPYSTPGGYGSYSNYNRGSYYPYGYQTYQSNYAQAAYRPPQYASNPSYPQPSVPNPSYPLPSVPNPSYPQPSVPNQSYPRASVPNPSYPHPSYPSSLLPAQYSNVSYTQPTKKHPYPIYQQDPNTNPNQNPNASSSGQFGFKFQ